ncbi:MAG: hypothetical protein P8M30_02125 [Planctomycetaceae bacterium]|nr:hypothetical protein [bacterium]MDC0274112.1 hypothetical protein [Planctomycetaceae bacterium]MDG2388094.1 hypothetical protein [Planctomycetaceae bacterium]
MTASLINEDDRRVINEAVANAESKTAAEIIPVVAESSGRYDRAEDICGLWLGLTCMVGVWILLPPPAREPGSWGGPSLLWYPVSLVVSVIVGFMIGVVISHHVPVLRRLFTPKSEREQEVANRSRQVFFDRRVHHHSDGQGEVLLYVSLFEHQAAIMTDSSTLEILTQETVNKLYHQFTNRLKHGSLKDAFAETINEIGTLLAEKLPATKNDRNELPDALVTLEGI